MNRRVRCFLLVVRARQVCAVGSRYAVDEFVEHKHYERIADGCVAAVIFALDDLPEKWTDFTARNAAYYGR